jgi:hypothetical protein
MCVDGWVGVGVCIFLLRVFVYDFFAHTPCYCPLLSSTLNLIPSHRSLYLFSLYLPLCSRTLTALTPQIVSGNMSPWALALVVRYSRKKLT